ncbi:cold-shock DNA-binding domain-containing protein [Variovorax paradoxus B4]|uniref:Cold-shock DNA-binding domain-containing protein n=1 Tax=Variovorax paradoxus B4 TaxID=1246301 RepID=T1X993_VARPD|nr:cold shock and DUF1294 domain-containing protein [Variovorax paradoxus]AGU49507.1 cold-shock DNA-binding domain-containing protein [Variovorax paradoxus B4]
MKRQGRLVRWEAERGFGFIRSPEVSADVFVHLRDFLDRQLKPQVGMELSFDEIHVGGKGPRAMVVHAVGAAQPRARRPSVSPQARRTAADPGRRRETVAPSSFSSSSSSMLPIGVLILGYAGLLGYGVWTARLPPIALGVLLLVSLLTFAVYGFDKSAAQAGRWRTAESTLHLLSLAGGWPGAWCAQRLFRHKSRKASFMAAYWATVLLNIAALAAWVGKLLPASLLAN